MDSYKRLAGNIVPFHGYRLCSAQGLYLLSGKTSCRQVSKMRDGMLELPYRSEIWQASR